MKSPSPPPAPDPVATASAQGAANTSTAVANQTLNMVDQYTPSGSLTYSQVGTTTIPNGLGGTINVPRYSATQTLSPEQQKLQDLSNQTEQNIATIGRDQSARIGSLLGTPLNFSSAPALYNPTFQKLSGNDYSADRQKVEDALMARMQPKLDQDRSALEAKLVNQGVRAGSTAYDDSMKNYGSQVNDARMAAILGAGDEQQRLFNMELSGTGFNNNVEQQQYANSLGTRQQGIQEMLTERNQPINEISALMSGSQVSQPTFTNTPNTQVGGVDYSGLVRDNYNAQMNIYNQKVASNNAMLGGLFGLAGAGATAAIKYSDWNLKTNIKQVGMLNNGLPVYTYRYKWGGPQEIGVMAQDVERVKPEAVVAMPSGFKAVDYAQAVEG